jgi:hypothetical protein
MTAPARPVHATSAPRGGEPPGGLRLVEKAGEVAREFVLGKPDACNLVLADRAAEYLPGALESLGYDLSTYPLQRELETATVTMAAGQGLPTVYLAQIHPDLMPPDETGSPLPYDFCPIGFMAPESSCLRILSKGFDAEPEKFLDWFQLWRDYRRLDVKFVGWKWVLKLPEKDDAGRAVVIYLDSPRAHEQQRPPLTVVHTPLPVPDTADPDAAELEAAERAPKRSGVFISYSHKDPAEWLESVVDHLTRLQRRHEVWTDADIRPGDRWRTEIENALARAKVAVFLVSTNFLNSPFIRNNELGPALEAAKSDGLRVFLVAASSCAFEDFPNMNEYHWAYGPPSDEVAPLDQLTAAKKRQALVGLYREVRDVLEPPDAR